VVLAVRMDMVVAISCPITTIFLQLPLNELNLLHTFSSS
jgi:hypothetical protein